MNRTVAILSCGLGALGLLGCQPRETATFCLFSSADLAGEKATDFECEVDSTSEDTKPPATGAADTLVWCASTIAAGGPYFLLHELPEGMLTIEALKIHMETPCETEDRDIEGTHVDGRYLLPFVPPKGGECSLIVTATMAQSELSCSIVRPPLVDPPEGTVDRCADLTALCAAEE